MKNRFLLVFILFAFFKGNTQEKRITIKGKVTSSSGAIDNIHVINKNSKKAVITDSNGLFEIPVKQQDTLLFSAVQFENKTSIISAQHIANFYILVNLQISVNDIKEVTLEKPENMARGLGLPNADKKPLNKLEGRLNYHTKSSLPLAILAAILNKRGGVNDMFYIISGKRKKDRKLKKLIDDDTYKVYQSQKIQEIRTHFGDAFFIKTIKIPQAEIDYFIKFCDDQEAIINLFSKNKELEIIDIFLKSCQEFLKELKGDE